MVTMVTHIMETVYRSRIRICLLLFSLLSFTNGQQLMITPRGRQIKTAGTGVILTCSLVQVSYTPDLPDIIWQAPDGSEITATKGRVYIELEGETSKKLYITSMTEADEGSYVCKVNLPPLLIEETTIALYEDINFVNTPTMVAVHIGESTLLPCVAMGQPEPTLSWRFKRQRIPVGEKSEKYLQQPEGLRINHIDREDNGTYECRAEVESQGNLKIRIITLNVLFEPQFTLLPGNQEVVKGSLVILRCEATANPEPEYEWYKEHEVQDGVKLKVKLGRGLDKTTHVIHEVDPTDEGRYFCRAFNTLGNKEVHADIRLMIPPKIEPLGHRVVMEGDDVTITCSASGYPAPTLSWKRSDLNLYYREGEQKDDPRITVDNTAEGVSKLVIRAVLPEDMGNYKCEGLNPAGRTDRTASITVQYAPTMITAGGSEMGWPGQTRTFNCTSKGEPLPDITWSRGGDFLRDNDTYRIHGKQGTSLLEITLTDFNKYVYGIYSCNAKNLRGHTTETFELRKAESPGMPGNVTVLSEAPTWVVLLAEEPRKTGGMPITSWQLRYNMLGEKHQEEKFFFGTGDMRIEGLEADTVYIFYLAAGNSVGFGKHLKFKVQTPPIVEKIERSTEPPHAMQPNLSGSNHTQLEAKQEKTSIIDVTAVRKNSEKDNSPPLIIIISIVGGVIFITIITIIIFIALRKKNKRDAHYGVKTVLRKRDKKEEVRISTEIDMMQLNNILPRKDSPLPQTPNGTLTRAPKTPQPDKKQLVAEVNGHVGQTQIVEEHPGRPLSDVPTLNCVLDPYSIQNQAWTQMMLQRSAMDTSVITNAEENEEDEMPDFTQEGYHQGYAVDYPPNEVGPYSGSPDDLPPPPPDFLMTDPPYTPFTDSTVVYNDVLDGYHSGDNADYTDSMRRRRQQYDRT